MELILPPLVQPTLKKYSLLWLCSSQTLSMTALGISHFAIGVWVYLQTGSVSLFALLEIAAVLPGLLISPMIGVYIDRLGAKLSLQWSDVLGAVTAFFLLLLFILEQQSLIWLVMLLVLSNLLTAGQFSAYSALSSQLSNPKKLAKTAAYTQMGIIGQRVLAPAMAGLLLTVFTVNHILSINILTFIVSVLVLTSFSLPSRAKPLAQSSVLAEIKSAWHLIKAHNLLSFTRYTFFTYFSGGFVIALSTPLVLSIASPQTVGFVMTGIGSGMLIGNLFAMNITKNHGTMTRLLGYDTLMACAMLAMLFFHGSLGITVCGFIFSFGLAGLLCEEQAIWQIRIDENMQGKVFSLRKVMTWAALPLSYGCAGGLADYVFEPYILTPAYLDNFAFIAGEGVGRGMAILIAFAGVIKLGLIIITLFKQQWRHLD
jgi:MFS transporter, DHA3 family, macrolide efflux protein